MTTLPYEVVDVFTDRPFTGNPLAVVFDAHQLATAQLQTLAREFHLSETAFVLPPTDGDATYRLRIFTPAQELPFAGHPSVGAAVTQLRRGAVSAGTVVQECGAGLLPITVNSAGTATLTGGQPTLGPRVDPAPLLAALGLAVADGVAADGVAADGAAADGAVVDGAASGEARLAGCGLEVAYVPVRPEAIARAALQGDPGVPIVSVFAWDAATATAHTRVFCPGVGVPEDPATGSAALGLGVWLVAAGLLPGDGTSRYTVHQGAEIHRPSTLECAVRAVGGAATSVTVTGHVVPIASGAIAIPPFVG